MTTPLVNQRLNAKVPSLLLAYHFANLFFVNNYFFQHSHYANNITYICSIIIMHKMTLTNVILIEGLFSGYSFREKIDPNPNGSIGVLQMKDILADYSNFDYQSLDKVNEFQFKDKFFLNKGDIVFVSKGVNNFAIVIDQVNFPVIASATFFIIRVDEKKIIPEYLAWYMNQREAQNYFSEKKAGTYVPNLNKQDIMDLPLKVPPINIQKAIAKTAMLLSREITILERLKENRKELIQTQLINLINND